MEIRLDCGEWYINGYVITGNEEYDIYSEIDEDREDCLYSSKDFESCLTWCYNS